MKFFFSLLVILTLLSCAKENLQNHDNNKMMSVMHALSKSMDSLVLMRDPDNDFSMMMKVHHQGAIKMANLELKLGKDQILLNLAKSIVAEQTYNIALLDSFLNIHQPPLDDTSFDYRARIAMDIMSKNADLQIINGNIDHDFATLLIPQHQGAIDLAFEEIQYGTSSGLRTMAGLIIEKQKEEITDLQDWLLK